jgi:hypothetical protein
VKKNKFQRHWYIKWSIFTGLLITAFYFTLLAMGRYLCLPAYQQKCDAAIVEGGCVVAKFKMDAAIQLWREGLVQNIIIVLNKLENVQAFALNDYPKRISAVLDSTGIPHEQYRILSVYAPDPFTYHTACEVAHYLDEKKLASAFIVHDGYHIRRSYLTYKKILSRYQVQIHPYTVGNLNDVKKWWLSALGIRRVISEYSKIFFYWINGYL